MNSAAHTWKVGSSGSCSDAPFATALSPPAVPAGEALQHAAHVCSMLLESAASSSCLQHAARACSSEQVMYLAGSGQHWGGKGDQGVRRLSILCSACVSMDVPPNGPRLCALLNVLPDGPSLCCEVAAGGWSTCADWAKVRWKCVCACVCVCTILCVRVCLCACWLSMARRAHRRA